MLVQGYGPEKTVEKLKSFNCCANIFTSAIALTAFKKLLLLIHYQKVLLLNHSNLSYFVVVFCIFDETAK